jgi:hypothetical protein
MTSGAIPKFERIEPDEWARLQAARRASGAGAAPSAAGAGRGDSKWPLQSVLAPMDVDVPAVKVKDEDSSVPLGPGHQTVVIPGLRARGGVLLDDDD